jgi:hypothetical protein
MHSNGIVEADELVRQRVVAGENSYRSLVVKVLDGLEAQLRALCVTQASASCRCTC